MPKPFGITRRGTTLQVDERGAGGRIATRWVDATTGRGIPPPTTAPILYGRLDLTTGYTASPAAPFPCYSILRRGSQTTPVQPIEQEFSRLIGPPEGPFALEFSFVGAGVENSSYSLVSASFRTLPVRPGTVYDASGCGFLVCLQDRGYPSTRGPHYPDLACLAPETGTVRWRSKASSGATWCGSFAVRPTSKGFEALDGATGRTVGRFAAPAGGSFWPLGGGRFLLNEPRERRVALWDLRLTRS